MATPQFALNARLMPAWVCALAVSGASSTARAQAAHAPGEAVYAKYCASCHEQVDARIPTRDSLTQMSPARILRTLDFGLMMSIASPIKRDDREAVAKFLGKGADDTKPPASAFCKPADRKIMSAERARIMERLESRFGQYEIPARE